MTQLLHRELSYQVRGVLFDVYNTMGPGLRESYYRDAIGIELAGRRIACEVEKGFEVSYENARVGLYYVDVWIEQGKILLELKVAPAIDPLHKAQAISYLKVTHADVAFVVNYGSHLIEIERLPNFLEHKRPEFYWNPSSWASETPYPECVENIQRACHRVHFTLGPGFLHQIYRRATMIELQSNQLSYEYITYLPVEYKGHLLGNHDVRLILVEGKILLATFALHATEKMMYEQFKTHLRRLKLQFGLFANFYGTKVVIVPVYT